MLSGGDDYELAFTAPASRHADIEALSATFRLALTCIGTIVAGASGEIELTDAAGRPVEIGRRGYDHFI